MPAITTAVNSGGPPLPQASCAGLWEIDWNAHLRQRFPPSSEPPIAFTAPPPGTTIHAQWLGRDPGLPTANNTLLSDGLQITLMP